MDNLKVSDEKKKYITEVLNPVLESLVTDCLAVMPDDTTSFILDWLKKKQGSSGGNASGGDLAKENEELEKTIRRMSSLMDEAGKTLQNLGAKDEEEEEEEEEDDDVDEMPENFMKPEGQMQKARASVSAEAYGAWNQKVEFTPPVHAKTDEQKERLKGVLSKSFLFSGLEGKELTQVIDAMEEVKAASGDVLVKQGDDGDFLFVVETGALDCVRKTEGADDKVLKTCEAGDVFGELALLYNCPRAANVVAKDACVLWKLDRNTFNAIVKDAAAKKRERYESFLQKVPLLSGLDSYEKSQVADAFKSEKYKDGEEIVKENEPGDKFYVIEDGTCTAEKSGDKVMDYAAGDYFGELALLRNQPRAATVKAVGETTVLALDRRTFKRLLGRLEDILNSKMNAYNTPTKA